MSPPTAGDAAGDADGEELPEVAGKELEVAEAVGVKDVAVVVRDVVVVVDGVDVQAERANSKERISTIGKIIHLAERTSFFI